MLTLGAKLIEGWEFDEDDGTRRGLRGTALSEVGGTIGSATGYEGNAANFVAANTDYLAGSVTFPAGSYSFNLKARFASTTGSPVLFNTGWQGAGALTRRDVCYIFGGNTIFFTVGSGVAAVDVNTTPTTVTTGVTYNIYGGIDVANDIAFCRIDNGTLYTAAYTATPNQTTAFRVGASADQNLWLNGWIDKLYLFNDILTTEEQAFLRAGGSPTVSVPPDSMGLGIGIQF